MKKDEHLEQLAEIRNLMVRSSHYFSLSGPAAIVAGFLAFLGYGFADYWIKESALSHVEIRNRLIPLSILILLLSLGVAIMLTYRKAKRREEIFWNATSRKMALDFAIPMISGGFVTLLLLYHHYYELLSGTMLVFYGLACISGSKYTFGDIRYLGYLFLVCGLAAFGMPQHSLLCWVTGFGAIHVVYGCIMFYRYDRNQ